MTAEITEIGEVGSPPREAGRSLCNHETEDAATSPPDKGFTTVQSSEPSTFSDFCKDMEAFETPRWAIDSVLAVETVTTRVVDPCSGTGAIAFACHEAGHDVTTFDLIDWSEHLPAAMKFPVSSTLNFLTDDLLGLADWHNAVVIMNPPFSLACEFVDRARALGARKIICFQRQAWRESFGPRGRRQWWAANKPARVWVCGARATCWRFDLLDCQHEGGTDACAHFKAKGKKKPTGEGCSKCMGGAPTSMAFYVWELGQIGAEITDAIYPIEKETENV